MAREKGQRPVHNIIQVAIYNNSNNNNNTNKAICFKPELVSEL